MARELLFSVTKDDFKIQTFRSGGPGGQNQNKVSSGVRIIHKESGARGESREERSQLQNRRNAFTRCIESREFQLWLKVKCAMMLNQPVTETLEQLAKRVDRMIEEDLVSGDIIVEYIGDDQ